MSELMELGTMNLAIRKLTPLPRPFSSWPMAVAVTLSSGGNQAEETAGGAEQKGALRSAMAGLQCPQRRCWQAGFGLILRVCRLPQEDTRWWGACFF